MNPRQGIVIMPAGEWGVSGVQRSRIYSIRKRRKFPNQWNGPGKAEKIIMIITGKVRMWGEGGCAGGYSEREGKFLERDQQERKDT